MMKPATPEQHAFLSKAYRFLMIANAVLGGWFLASEEWAQLFIAIFFGLLYAVAGGMSQEAAKKLEKKT